MKRSLDPECKDIRLAECAGRCARKTAQDRYSFLEDRLTASLRRSQTGQTDL